MNVQVGDKVKVKNDRPEGWFKKGSYPEFLSGEVLKVFDNGNFSMRINDLKKSVEPFKAEEIVK